MTKKTTRFKPKPLKNELAIFRSFLRIVEKQAQDLMNKSWTSPELSDEYFRDSLVALLHVTTRTHNKVKLIEEKLEKKGG